MRVENEINASGFFWLPRLPENKIPGTLKVDKTGDIYLEIIGSFNSTYSEREMTLGRIFGNIERHGPVTLEDCFYEIKTSAFDNVAKSKIISNLATIGFTAENAAPLQLSSFKFSTEGLDEWLDLSGINICENFKNKTCDIKYVCPENISICLKNGMQLTIAFDSHFPFEGNVFGAEITQKAYIHLKSPKPIHIDRFKDCAYMLNSFMCLATNSTVCIDYMAGYFSEDNQKNEHSFNGGKRVQITRQ